MILRLHLEQEIKMINREISKRERKAITERAMEELAQLAAVSDKFIDSIKAGEDDGIYTEK